MKRESAWLMACMMQEGRQASTEALCPLALPCYERLTSVPGPSPMLMFLRDTHSMCTT